MSGISTKTSQFVKKLGDTLGVKMYEFAVKPGESFALHSHPDHTAYILQGGKVALYIKALGRQDTLDFPTGMAIINGPVSDSGTSPPDRLPAHSRNPSDRWTRH